MPAPDTIPVHDAVIIGGGFYGCAIAIHLARQRGLRRILLLEREPRLFGRASGNNQARVHNGYHYPRSFTTAYRSRINFPQFVREWPAAVKKDFTKLYAIARNNSKVNAKQFQRFCREIGARLLPAEPSERRLFEPRLIEDVFVAEEYVFDFSELARTAQSEMAACGVEVRMGAAALGIRDGGGNRLLTAVQQPTGAAVDVASRYVFNCSYSGLNQLRGDFDGTRTALKHEMAEMALIRMPRSLSGLAITVMDGPFFSMLPFPSRRLHTLSHVRYTPHFHWQDRLGDAPHDRLQGFRAEPRAERMLRDVERYLPAIRDAEYVDSLFEIKTVLAKNEGDDGRPILFEGHDSLPNVYSILGGKIDNIYDALEKISALPLCPSTR